MSAVTISQAWLGFGAPFTVAELDRMPSDGHRCPVVLFPVTTTPADLTRGLPR